MRHYQEPTARNLLHEPKVMGVSFTGLTCLGFSTICTVIIGGDWPYTPVVSLGVASTGYLALRIAARYARVGHEATLLFNLQQHTAQFTDRIKLRISKEQPSPCRRSIRPKYLSFKEAPFKISAHETLSQSELLYEKSKLLDQIALLRPNESCSLSFDVTGSGAECFEVIAQELKCPRKQSILVALTVLLPQSNEQAKAPFVYSLINLPAYTDPLWISAQLRRITDEYKIFVRIWGVDHHKIKRHIELSRRRNAGAATTDNVDSEVSFQESTRILEGLTRGDETLARISLVVASNVPLDLDPQYFALERHYDLALASATGLRPRPHRSFFVRGITASDLVPNLQDPFEIGLDYFKSRNNKKAVFNPLDPRLDALHWLVVGASGSGKSFFTACILRRMVCGGLKASVLFLDHNRGFKRFLQGDTLSSYFEPQCLADLELHLTYTHKELDVATAMVGIELSDLTLTEKKQAAKAVLQSVSKFLKNRKSEHVVYVVLDECWNFLRDEPTLVQQAFREFRKLNGAAIAITQSLSDFLRDESGQSIVQNAAVRILLRQGEDMAPYRGALSLNNVEVDRVRELRQTRGEFSECLIKTPYMSRILRLYPTPEEHELLRTDNLKRTATTGTAKPLTTEATPCEA